MRRALISAVIILGAGGPGAAPAIAQRAGTLIAADPVTDPPAGQQAWRIRYWTSGDDGRAIGATAMVVAPREAVARVG